MKKVYFKNGEFFAEQDEFNSRYETTEDYQFELFKEVNSRSHEDDLKHIVGFKADDNGKPFVDLIPRSTEEQKSILRRLRVNRVFPIVNRSNFWFNSLTQQQKDELQVWYQAWLDATETLEIPDRPTWLD